MNQPRVSADKKTRFELIVELVKAGAWPLLVAILVGLLWSPLYETALQIPATLKRSEAVSIGEFSLKVRRDFAEEVSPEVKGVLAMLSGPGVGQLLRLKDTLWTDAEDEKDIRNSMRELMKLGLVTEVSPQDLKQHNSETHGYTWTFGVRITELGKSTRAFLRTVVSEIAREVGGQSNDSDKTREN
jgi:hypothetical protein